MTQKAYDEAVARDYENEGPARFAPGYRLMQQMALQLLSERAPDDARILVLGAGGGQELRAFATARPGWTFEGVDPSGPMIAEAGRVLEGAGVRDRVSLRQGYIPDAPEGTFDGATCILTMHFVLGEDLKMEALRTIRSRLRPGARFILVDISMEQTGPDFETWRSRYRRWMLDAGMDLPEAELRYERLATGFHLLPPHRHVELLTRAGFTEIEPFYAALCWRGWAAVAG